MEGAVMVTNLNGLKSGLDKYLEEYKAILAANLDRDILFASEYRLLETVGRENAVVLRSCLWASYRLVLS